MAEYMDGDYYAIPLSDTEYLIAPKVEQDAVIYLRTVLSHLSDSVLSSTAMKTHAAYEYDAGENRMNPFYHLRILSSRRRKNGLSCKTKRAGRYQKITWDALNSVWTICPDRKNMR